jgi:DNA-binding transcriptional regulator YiaG
MATIFSDAYLKQARAERRLHLWKCCRILGVDRGTLADWEVGKHRPMKEHWPKIVSFLGFDPRAIGHP